MNAQMVFDILIQNMSSDNGFDFEPTEEQRATAIHHVQTLMDAGFFREDESPNDLESSFWVMVAGEESERDQYFKDAPVLSYAVLNDVLNEIFDGG